MDENFVLDKNTGYVSGCNILYRDAAILHQSFIGLVERMWKAFKNRNKAPFKDMNLPEIGSTDFGMKIIGGIETENGTDTDITVVRFYVKNVFTDDNRKWFPFREMTLKTFRPYNDYPKTGRYEIDSVWGWFRKMKALDMKYEHLYNDAQALTCYFDACVSDFLGNDIHVD